MINNIKLIFQGSKAFEEGYKTGRQDAIDKVYGKLLELKCGLENDLDAEPRAYERDIQICSKISLLEKLILELMEE